MVEGFRLRSLKERKNSADLTVLEIFQNHLKLTSENPNYTHNLESGILS